MDPFVWTIIPAASAAISAIFAAVYTWLTFRLVRSQSEPNVVVYVRHDEARASLLQIVVENLGRGIASDLQFKSSSPIPARAFGLDDKAAASHIQEDMKSGPLIDGIPSLGPNDSRKIVWGQYAGLKRALREKTIVITCNYKHGKRQMPTVTAVLEVQSFTGTDAVSSEAARVVKALEGIRELFSQLVNGGAGERMPAHPIDTGEEIR